MQIFDPSFFEATEDHNDFPTRLLCWGLGLGLAVLVDVVVSPKLESRRHRQAFQEAAAKGA